MEEWKFSASIVHHLSPIFLEPGKIKPLSGLSVSRKVRSKIVSTVFPASLVSNKLRGSISPLPVLSTKRDVNCRSFIVSFSTNFISPAEVTAYSKPDLETNRALRGFAWNRGCTSC